MVRKRRLEFLMGIDKMYFLFHGGRKQSKYNHTTFKNFNSHLSYHRNASKQNSGRFGHIPKQNRCTELKFYLKKKNLSHLNVLIESSQTACTLFVANWHHFFFFSLHVKYDENYELTKYYFTKASVMLDFSSNFNVWF